MIAHSAGFGSVGVTGFCIVVGSKDQISILCSQWTAAPPPQSAVPGRDHVLLSGNLCPGKTSRLWNLVTTFPKIEPSAFLRAGRIPIALLECEYYN